MSQPIFIQSIKAQLIQNLPGLAAQEKMFPFNRQNRSLPSAETIEKAKKAAVCLLLYEKEASWHFVLIKRTTYEGVHSGQMAFPGGRVEDEDGSMEVTALRETEEEVGIDRKKIEVLGKLSPVYIPPSNTWVQPVVAYLSYVPTFKAQETEVAQIVEVPLLVLADPNIQKQEMVMVAKGTSVKVPCFQIDQHIVWGATAIMLSEWLMIFEQVESENN